MRRARRQSGARPPVDRLFGIRLVRAEAGNAGFLVPAHGWLVNEFGIVYGGLVAFLAKSATAAAAQAVAASGAQWSALDLKVNFIRPVAAGGAELTAIGSVVHSGRQLVIASSVVMHQGKTVAIATGTTGLATYGSGAERSGPHEPGAAGKEKGPTAEAVGPSS